MSKKTKKIDQEIDTINQVNLTNKNDKIIHNY